MWVWYTLHTVSYLYSASRVTVAQINCTTPRDFYPWSQIAFLHVGQPPPTHPLPVLQEALEPPTWTPNNASKTLSAPYVHRCYISHLRTTDLPWATVRTGAWAIADEPFELQSIRYHTVKIPPAQQGPSQTTALSSNFPPPFSLAAAMVISSDSKDLLPKPP